MNRSLLAGVTCSLFVIAGGLLAQEPLRSGPPVGAPKRTEVVTVVPTSRDKEQQWRYTLTRPADHWVKPDFNDLSWKTGPGGFGNRGTPNGVDRTPWHPSEIWLRREIILPN